MKRFLSFLLFLILLLPAAAPAETIVTSFYPVWVFTLNLTQGLEDITVRNLAAPETGCLHDYTLQPSDMKALAQADALLINGGGMESFLPLVTAAYPELPVIDASVDIAQPEEGTWAEFGEPEEGEEGNSHFWMDPSRAVRMVSNLAEGLVRILPDDEAAIRENLAAYTARLEQVAEMLKGAAEESGVREVVIIHEAFPYFAEACGLPVLAVVEKEPEDDLPVGLRAEVIRLIASREEAPLLIKSRENDPVADMLSAETGAPVCELNTLTSGPEDAPLDFYETAMAENLAALLAAFSPAD
ncbi:MAG: metal ABC transporter substrate-binding protein [Clostridiales bacterium]|nr:metal ABC transporter substrate-binding protein [Clostridiales bacterium]